MSDWETTQGDHWAEHAERYGRMLAPYGDLVVEAAALQPGERVLDVGCGNGDLAVLAAAAVAPGGHVQGIDLSPAEVAVATARAERAGLADIAFTIGDATRVVPPGGPFDVLVSRFGVMFFPDPVAAFTHLHGLMAPGGRLAFACWQELRVNDWMMVPGAAVAEVLPLPAGGDPTAPGPFAFADPDRVRSILGQAGFGEIEAAEAPAELWLGADADEAAWFLRQSGLGRAMFDGADPALAADATARATAALAAHQRDDGVWLGGAAWLVTARV